MSERASAGFGRRLAKYRKLAGLSARELSEALGGEMSRGVIANIESGRKTDITIDQLIALAWALDVPPVVLALPVDEPYRAVRTVSSPGELVAVRSWALAKWFEGKDEPGGIGSPDPTPAGAFTREMMSAIAEYFRTEDGAARSPEGTEDRHVRELELRGQAHTLRQLKVDMTPHFMAD
ncbi:helix-turn-helix domain-containing protein [Frigoribacterium sp. PhB160]|uniref:helix-turn-helix domain-containing protein n=1 Tax=Frigoribacterium sp. PhB160 TaxID=2485192 RepID=UPI0013152A40|nr:helix-turn-helix transcriptional regulator [Frigoribacterium sp. PhB160]